MAVLEDYEWNDDKARTNVQKHGISFFEAMEVFDDPFVKHIRDARFTGSEERWYAIGRIPGDKLLVVWYTDREKLVRIIGARKATNAERRRYENE